MNGDGPTTCFAEGEDLRHRVEQLERQLAASEQRFLAFTERSSDVVALLDSSGVICAVSPAIAHILGYAPADCLGAPLSPLVHPDDQPRIVPLLEALALVPGASASVQLRMRHQNGQWRWMEAIAKNQLAIPHVGGIVLNVHDVTTLHRAEEELRSERDLMSGALYASAAAIVAFSATAQVAYANERAAQLLGLPLADLLGQGDQGGSSPPTPAQRRRSPELDLLFRQVMERGEPIMDMRRSICPPGGEQRLLSLNGVPVRAATGEICSVVISIVDSTEQQLFAQQLSRRQQIEAVGRLAGGVAHDFNNALTVILGACSFLMDEVGQNPTVQHDLEQIQEAGERVSVLTRQLLALSRQQSPMPQPIQLNTSIERLRLMLQRMLGRQIELRLHLAPALDLIHADAHQIDLVLVNLVAHALDSMPQGGTVLIETAEVELDAGSVPGHVLVPGRYAMLAVSDTGEGMAMAAREQIFDPFLASRRPGSSTGLVLWSVQNTALQSGGAIWVASDLGYGSTFKVFLPFAAAADAPPPPAPLAAPIARTVLVVEPDPAALAFARDVLAQAGYHVIGAASAEHARASAALADAVDLLIVDALAPDLAPLLRWLGERWPQVGALYTSGHTRSVLDALAPDLAAQPELLRPFGAAALLTRVRAHCFGDVGVG